MPAKRRKLYCLPRLKIAAMTNDTVATLASLAYLIPSLPNTRVVMGLIVGAGCNATVPFRITDLHESKTRHIRAREPDAIEALVSTEWNLSSATAAPLHELGVTTAWDTELDMHSQRPGFQPFEYMVGGRYIGELVRIICYDWFHRSRGIPRSALPQKLIKEYSLTTEFLSLFVASNYCNERLASDLSEHCPPPATSSWSWTPGFAGDVRAIASAVQDRSAALVASAVVGLLVCTREIQLQSPDTRSAKIDQNLPVALNVPEQRELQSGFSSQSGWKHGPEELAVAVSGGVIQHYYHYKETVQRYIDRLLLCAGAQEGGKSVFLREVSDGGIIGIGVLAGTASGEIGEIIGSSFQKENASHGDPK
jgi:hexokinase